MCKLRAYFAPDVRAKFILLWGEYNPNIKKKKTKVIQCIDCGEWFEVDKNNVKTCRCPKCNIEHNRELRRLQTRRYRENKKCSS